MRVRHRAPATCIAAPVSSSSATESGPSGWHTMKTPGLGNFAWSWGIPEAPRSRRTLRPAGVTSQGPTFPGLLRKLHPCCSRIRQGCGLVGGNPLGPAAVVGALYGADLLWRNRPGRQVGLAPGAGLGELVAIRVAGGASPCHLADKAELAMAPLAGHESPGTGVVLGACRPGLRLYGARGAALPREGAGRIAEIEARCGAAEFAKGRVRVRHGEQVAKVPTDGLGEVGAGVDKRGVESPQITRAISSAINIVCVCPEIGELVNRAGSPRELQADLLGADVWKGMFEMAVFYANKEGAGAKQPPHQGGAQKVEAQAALPQGQGHCWQAPRPP